MVLPKEKLTRSDFCLLRSTLLPEYSPTFPVCPEPQPLLCTGPPLFPFLFVWATCSGAAHGQVGEPVLLDPSLGEVTTAFSAVRPLSRGCPLQTAASYHRNCGNVISLGFLLLHQIELKSIQGFPSCSVGGGAGEAVGQAAQVIALILTGKKKNTRKARRA